jgi:hypothetical protein
VASNRYRRKAGRRLAIHQLTGTIMAQRSLWPGSDNPRSRAKSPRRLVSLVRLAVLLLPAGLLLLGSLRAEKHGNAHLWLSVGAAFQILFGSLSFHNRTGWRQPLGPAALLLYLTGVGWLWLAVGTSELDDWYLHFAQAILLVVSVVVFAVQILVDSGAEDRRRAQTLAQRLAERKDWPKDLRDCAALPEVKALREALNADAAPALALLGHRRTQVRVAALAALDFHKHWRRGQAEMVLRLARQSEEPVLRARAVSALANLDYRPMVEQLAEFLHDPSWDVRRATVEALLWDTGRNWLWTRHVVRRTLADAAFLDDGPLFPRGQDLTPEVVNDLTAWAGEKGVLAVRAALTLGVHYSRVLNESPGEILITELRRQLTDPHAPTPLRLELAHLLLDAQLLDREMLEGLLDSMNPAPLRLIAADALLEMGYYELAVASLRDVARVPNREIALATADLVQRRLGVELGLPRGQSLPPVHSRLAAEVTRRVMLWATQVEQPEVATVESIPQIG